MQYSQEHLKTMVYAKFGGQTECIMGNWKIENSHANKTHFHYKGCAFGLILKVRVLELGSGLFKISVILLKEG